MEPKSNPGASKSPFGERSEYKPQKKTPKSGPRGAKSLQTPLKSFPKSSPSPPKIDLKTQAKKTVFLEAYFSRFSSILASKTTKCSMKCYHVLASKFHRFLRPFRPPNPWFFDSCSTPLNIDSEKLDFIKICIFLKEKRYFSGFEHYGKQRFQLTNNKTTYLKTNKITYIFPR